MVGHVDIGFAVSDKLVHFTIYAIFAFLLITTFRIQGKYPKLRHFGYLLGILVAVIYGGILEYLQLLVPGRSSDLQDIGANFAGSIAGFMTFLILFRKKS